MTISKNIPPIPQNNFDSLLGNIASRTKPIIENNIWRNTQAQYFLVLVTLLFANKTVNLNRLFGGIFGQVTGSNYIDVLISGWDILLVFGVVILGINKSKLFIRSQKSSINMSLIIGLIILFGSLFVGGIMMFLQVLRFGSLVILLGYFYKSKLNDCKTPLTLIVVVFLYSILDHLLISSSLPVVLVGVVFCTNFWNKSKILTSFVVVNAVLAIWQVVFGKSFGLGWVGEPTINIDMYSQVAKQIINFDLTILRGYGLSQHPNILGLIGVMVFLYNSKSDYFSKFLQYSSVLVVFLSFSRIGLLSLLIIAIVQSYSKALNDKPNQIEIIRGFLMRYGFFAVLIGLFFSRRDIHRINDLGLWFVSFAKQDIFGKLFGNGYYPRFLSANKNLEIWQLQPVHNVWLNIIFQLGIVGSFLFIIILILLIRSQKSFDKTNIILNSNDSLQEL